MASAPEIVLTDAPDLADRATIAAGIVAFNDPRFGPANFRPLAVLLRDADGATVGGLWGRTVHDWLYIELLFVPEAMRGQGLGAELMSCAEAEARARGCLGAWVDTFDDGARALYEKLGYVAFGELEGQPKGGRRTFYRKAFA
jgi:GNAT superfamily N-acetyltransferase